MNPSVTIIVPCFNEELTVQHLLHALHEQHTPLEEFEVVIADGMSTDSTRARIDSFAASHPSLRVQLVDNPERTIPAALNRALAAAQGETIIRLDAHSVPSPDYIARVLDVLESTGAANVGGVWEIRPSHNTWIGRAIAAAAAHPLGAGDARYRIGGAAGPVDTVPFGAFRKEWIERVGPFDESLHSNEDYELNVRLRRSGGKVWFDPSIRSVYFARGDWISLARQYARYGFWKARMLARDPRSLRWRQVLPPLFVAMLLVLIPAAVAWPPVRPKLAAMLGTYWLTIALAGALAAVRRRDSGLVIGLPISLAVMHLAWGGAFLWGLIPLSRS